MKNLLFILFLSLSLQGFSQTSIIPSNDQLENGQLHPSDISHWTVISEGYAVDFHIQNDVTVEGKTDYIKINWAEHSVETPQGIFKLEAEPKPFNSILVSWSGEEVVKIRILWTNQGKYLGHVFIN